MTGKEETSYDKHLMILQAAGDHGIESWDLAGRSGILITTNREYIRRRRIEGYDIKMTGIERKMNCRYIYMSGPVIIEHKAPERSTMPFELMNKEQFKGECLRIAAGYPEDHPQRAAILEQHRRLEAAE